MTTMQQFLDVATRGQSEKLLTALQGLPDDKRAWSPASGSRSALDQVAECAMLNGSMAALLNGNPFPKDFSFEKYLQEKLELAQDPDRTVELLKTNTEAVCSAIAKLTDSDLEKSVQMPWGSMTFNEMVRYPLWNMSYHEGQITYIKLMLEEAASQ